MDFDKRLSKGKFAINEISFFQSPVSFGSDYIAETASVSYCAHHGIEFNHRQLLVNFCECGSLLSLEQRWPASHRRRSAFLALQPKRPYLTAVT